MASERSSCSRRARSPKNPSPSATTRLSSMSGTGVGRRAKKRAASGAATDPPERPRSPSTATATSPRSAMNHAWVGRGVAAPELRGAALARAARPRRRRARCPSRSVTTSAHQAAQRCRARRPGAQRPGPRADRTASSRGARQRPSATVAATPRHRPAGWRGSRACPIIAAARSTPSSAGGHAAARGRDREAEFAPEPVVARGPRRARGASDRSGVQEPRSPRTDVRGPSSSELPPALTWAAAHGVLASSRPQQRRSRPP